MVKNYYPMVINVVQYNEYAVETGYYYENFKLQKFTEMVKAHENNDENKLHYIVVL